MITNHTIDSFAITIQITMSISIISIMCIIIIIISSSSIIMIIIISGSHIVITSARAALRPQRPPRGMPDPDAGGGVPDNI